MWIDHHVFNVDSLRAISRHRQKAAERFFLLSARLIAPIIEESFATGYEWILQVYTNHDIMTFILDSETIKASSHADIGHELEIAKAITYLKAKDFGKAIEALKSFEKKDMKLVGTASTNLSFLYFLEGDYKQAERYADLAIQNDRYNARALTNRGNCYYAKGIYLYLNNWR